MADDGPAASGRIVSKRTGQVQRGQLDAYTCRTKRKKVGLFETFSLNIRGCWKILRSTDSGDGDKKISLNPYFLFARGLFVARDRRGRIIAGSSLLKDPESRFTSRETEKQGWQYRCLGNCLLACALVTHLNANPTSFFL